MDERNIAKNNIFLSMKDKGGKILLSELLVAPPSDDLLLELFSLGRGGQPFTTKSALEIMKLRLEGLTAKEVGEKLGLTLGQVNGRFQTLRVKLMSDILPDCIEIDVPGIRRLRRLDVPITSGYTKVSELLRDMPSDRELLELSISRGYIVNFNGRRTITHDDLVLLKRKEAGQRDAAIARELDVGRENIRRRLVWIRTTLRQRLGIQIDMPELFPYEESRG